jgi:hypothetical protein
MSYTGCGLGKRISSDAFAKLRKATISVVISVCLSVRPYVSMEQLGSQLTEFQNILEYISKTRVENHRFIKI